MSGTESGAESFFSTVHGSGRVMSRNEAKKKYHGRTVQKDLENRGIYVKTASYSGLAEEAGGAYKNIDQVVEAAEKGGLGKIAARFIPAGNIKG
jgi:tRNA-splicing ligase RtcB